MIDILKLYQHFNIDHRATGHKHCRSGWVQIECPECNGNRGYHLGYCIDPRSKFAGSFVCWRCGGHSVNKVLKSILPKLSFQEAKEIARSYRISGGAGPSIHQQVKLVRNPFKYPSGTEELTTRHIHYLIKRKFDPDYIKQEWGVLGTGPFSSLTVGRGKERKSIDFRHRLIIPIEYQEKIVSFQGRDITNHHKLKYLACPEEREIINLKKILYGKTDGEQCVLVEGVTDVWRLGFGAVSCFGIKYTIEQIRLLSKFKRIFILFDPEEQATKQARKIQSALNFRGTEAIILGGYSTDPGDMKQSDADYLMEELGL